MAQLPSFLPALFEAFGNQSADVRKVLCLFYLQLFVVHQFLLFFFFRNLGDYFLLGKEHCVVPLIFG